MGEIGLSFEEGQKSGLISTPTPETPSPRSEIPIFQPEGLIVAENTTSQDIDQASRLKIPKLKIGLHLISKGEKVLVSSGIQPETAIIHAAERLALFNSLKLNGFDPILFESAWKSDESWPDKEYRHLDVLGRQEIKKEVAYSSAGRLAVEAYRKGKLDRMVGLDAWVNDEDETNEAAKENLRKDSSSLVAAVDEGRGKGPVKDPSDFLLFYTEFDELVPASTATIPGAKNVEVKIPKILLEAKRRGLLEGPWVHRFAIGDRLVNGGPQMAKHFRG